MQFNNLFFTSLLFSYFLSLTAQTKIIAHKSHSGSSNTFSIHSIGNFGGVDSWKYRIDSLIKLSDTVVVKTYYSGARRDTIVNCPLMSNPNVKLDSVKQFFHSQVRFVGFGDLQEGLPAPILTPPKKPVCTKPTTGSISPTQKTKRRKQRAATIQSQDPK